MPSDDPRLDKWLWSVRVFKTRPLATAACRAGKVTIGELEAKPGRDVHAGEIVTVRLGALTRTLKVIAMPRSRVAAKQLPEFLEDLTPAAQYEQAKLPRCFVDFGDMRKANATGYFPYTPSIPMLYGLRESIDMLLEEGLEQVFARHHRLAEGTRLAVGGW